MYLTSLCPILHDKSQNTIASPTNVQKLTEHRDIFYHRRDIFYFLFLISEQHQRDISKERLYITSSIPYLKAWHKIKRGQFKAFKIKQ